MNNNNSCLKELLDNKAEKYDKLSFINTDPIQIPKQYTKKEDIEISGFLTSVIAWGRRDMIIKSATRLMEMMGNQPYQFITNAQENDLKQFQSFKYRTFSSEDCITYLRALKNIYNFHGGLEAVFTKGYQKDHTIFSAIQYFRSLFFEIQHQHRCEKHISDVTKGSAAKRINMFLRWMIRQDKNGVDFGIWENIPQSSLLIPLDVHSARQSRRLGILMRKQNDWKAVVELTNNLRKFDPNDPIKYDFALFGMGVFNDVEK